MNSISEWIANFSWITVLDLAFIGFLVYYIYKLVRGTTAFNITLSILGIYIFWFIAKFLQMPLTSEILGKVVSIGLFGLVVVFQPEIRRFLFMITNPNLLGSRKSKMLKKMFTGKERKKKLNVTQVVQACMHLSQSKTGALIILARENRLTSIISTGEPLHAIISSALIENIFFKNTPLHDGAMILDANKIMAARCILPVTANKHISADLGLRHRSAIGITEQTDALAIIVSEETGSISISSYGDIVYNISGTQLRNQIEEFFTEEE